MMGIGAGSLQDYVDMPLHEQSIVAEQVKRIQERSK